MLSSINLSGRTLFNLFIVFLFGGALAFAVNWPLRASVIVLVLGGAGLALALVQLFTDLVQSREKADSSKPTYETPSLDSEDAKLGSRATYETWGWLVGLVVAIPIVGLPVALTLFVFLYTKLHGGGWLISLFLTALIVAFIFGVYVEIMHVYWPPSLLGHLLSGVVEL